MLIQSFATSWPIISYIVSSRDDFFLYNENDSKIIIYNHGFKNLRRENIKLALIPLSFNAKYKNKNTIFFIKN